MAGWQHRHPRPGRLDAPQRDARAVDPLQRQRRSAGCSGGSPVAAHRAVRAGQRAALAGAGDDLAAGPVPVPHRRPAEHPSRGRPPRGHHVARRGPGLRPPGQVPGTGRQRDGARHAEVGRASRRSRRCARMDSRPEVVLRIRVVSGALLGGRHPRARDRMLASRRRPPPLLAFRGRRGAGFRLANRRPRPAVAAAAAADAARVDVRAGRHAERRREPARFRRAVQRPHAAAGGGHARGVLPSEQGPGQRYGRRGPGDAPAMRLEVVHETRYRYSGPIAETVMEVRLRPMDGNGQRCVKFDLDVSSGIKPREYRDGYGNNVHYFNLVPPHTGLSVTSRSVVETGLEPDADPGEDLVQDFLWYRSPVKDVPGVRELASRHPIAEGASGAEMERALEELTLTISREFAYDRAVTNVYSAVE